MGYFISIEGADGTGKSTVMNAIRDFFSDRGVQVVLSREPGGVPISEAIREILLSSAYPEMDARTEALLFAAARRQHYVEKLLPLLDTGRIVVLDRFIDSSIVYQGYARGIGPDAVEEINDFALNGFRPDLTLLLDMDVDAAFERIAKNPSREVNKLDLEARDFHRRVREGYLALSDSPRNRDRIRKVDASKSPDEVAASVRAILGDMCDRILASISEQ